MSSGRQLLPMPVDGEVGARVKSLAGVPGDPSGRLVAAFAMEGDLHVTPDRRVLDWPGPVSRPDASE